MLAIQNPSRIDAFIGASAFMHAGPVRIDVPDRNAPEFIGVVVRHPERAKIARVWINGRSGELDGETILLHRPSGHMQIVCEYASKGLWKR